MMIAYCIADLVRLKDLLEQLAVTHYTYRSQLLSGASIGQHTRHILEFYGCLVQANESVNYDARPRSMELETSTQAAIRYIWRLVAELQQIEDNQTDNSRSLALKANFSAEGEKEVVIRSSILREMAYCLEHSIHHQALIKVGLLEQGLSKKIPDNFGVAPATIRHRAII